MAPPFLKQVQVGQAKEWSKGGCIFMCSAEGLYDSECVHTVVVVVVVCSRSYPRNTKDVESSRKK